jgi:anaerobic selenocysteine-containing dehydrogenase
VRLSETAGLSDEWLPLVSGTDGLVALAMAHAILERGLHDKAFLARWTNCPEERLRRHLAPHTPERAQEETGISAAEIRRIALEFATRRPAVAFAGDGVSLHVNGTQAERCILLLNAVVGNIDEPGGYCLPKRFSWEEPGPSRSRGSGLREMDPAMGFKEILDGPVKVGLYLAHMANPAYSLPHSDEVRRLLLSEERILNLVVMDSHLSETAMLADLVLPAATYLESWGLESRPAMGMVPYVGLRQPVLAPMPETERLKAARVNRLDQPAVRPRGEALPWDDVLLGIAWRMGGELAKSLAFQGPREYLERILEQIPALEQQGGLGYLRKNGVWSPQGQRPEYRSFESKGFPTASGLLEIFSRELESKGVSPMPSYAPVKKFKGEALTLVPFKGLAWRAHPNAKWLTEQSHESCAWINAATAKGLGLSDGDRVQVSSQGRRVILRLRASQGVQPGVLAIPRGLGHWGYGHFATGDPFKGSDPDSHLVWWKKHGNGIHLEPLIPIRLDPIGEGQAWMDTMVQIKKV